jgi:hypothetical protein
MNKTWAVAKVVKVEERFVKRYVEGSGVKEAAMFEDKSIGWFILLDNNYAFGIGSYKPDFVVGEEVRISIGKMP